MTSIELTTEEQELLSQVLQNSLATLEVEIRHTDHAQFKDHLKRRRETLKGLTEKVQTPMPANP